jgi:hypothetical protein
MKLMTTAALELKLTEAKPGRALREVQLLNAPSEKHLLRRYFCSELSRVGCYWPQEHLVVDIEYGAGA